MNDHDHNQADHTPVSGQAEYLRFILDEKRRSLATMQRAVDNLERRLAVAEARGEVSS